MDDTTLVRVTTYCHQWIDQTLEKIDALKEKIAAIRQAAPANAEKIVKPLVDELVEVEADLMRLTELKSKLPLPETEAFLDTFDAYLWELDNNAVFFASETLKAELGRLAYEKCRLQLQELNEFVDSTVDHCILNDEVAEKMESEEIDVRNY